MLKLAGLVFCALAAANAAVIGQIDTFEDGTTQGWFVPGPHPLPPTNIGSGGPGGSADSFLLVTAFAFLPEAGSRFSAHNDSQWAGNYLAAGIGSIIMDVRNFGPDDLYLRLLLEDFEGPGPPVNLALSADAIFVPAQSDWVRVVVPVTAGALLPAGLGTVAGALASVDTLRLFHNPNPEFPGPGVGPPRVTALAGIDNIEAAAIPEPGTMILVGAGLLLASSFRRRK
ncbi:MAG: PEP-CTERM sorting domain-containing protein [Bryobacteraceae bacterium]|nr:PEP-CTERM sorting domain-containing protein [Bryobacteraceae bacterium]